MTTRYEHLFSGENARTMCNDCGCNVIDQRLHDKFHDDYKPKAKASFVIHKPDESIHVQFIDGTTAELPSDAFAGPAFDDQLLAFVNSTNERLAPFYEGGDWHIGFTDEETKGGEAK
jgi:hypothetical protein